MNYLDDRLQDLGSSKLESPTAELDLRHIIIQNSLEKFVNEAELMGKANLACMAAAVEADYRNDPEEAYKWVSSVNLKSDFANDAIRLRIELLGEAILRKQKITDDDALEIAEIIRYISVHPEGLQNRLLFEELIEKKLVIPESIALLVHVLMKAMADVYNEGISFFTNQSRQVFAETPQNDNRREPVNLNEFVLPFLEHLSKTGYVLFLGEAPENLVESVSSEVLDELISSLEAQLDIGITDEDLPFLYSLLHIISLVSYQVDDHNGDLHAVGTTIQHLPHWGYAQEARDIAETALQFLPGKWADYELWRTSQLWAFWAEAYHRSGNMVSSLAMLCHCFVSLDVSNLEPKLFFHCYRLGTRILRDCRLTNLARDVLRMEVQLREVANLLGSKLVELSQLELSIDLIDTDSSDSDQLVELFDRCHRLSVQDLDGEAGPILSLQSDIMGNLKRLGISIPPEQEDYFWDKMKSLSPYHQELLTLRANADLDFETLYCALEKFVAPAINYSDLAYQLRPILKLLHYAITVATDKQDPKLFLLASTFLSQPTLTLRSLSQRDASALDQVKIREWSFQVARAEHTGSELLDAHTIVQKVAPPIKQTLVDLRNLSIEQIQSSVASDEVLAILAYDSNRNLCRLDITREGGLLPERLPSDVWSDVRFQEWNQSYPTGYAWQPPPDPFTDESPSLNVVIDSVSGLSVGQFDNYSKVTIVPEANLFRFPFVLSPGTKGFIGEGKQIAIAPSVPWLFHARAVKSKTFVGKRAWLGSSELDDWTLHLLRDRITPILEDHQFTVIDSRHPVGMDSASLAIIGAHGGTGLTNHFRVLTDTVTQYSAKEFAESLKNCHCVILFVCNSGRSEVHMNSAETVGLAAELLMHNVRCVVAPPWPLYVGLAKLWLVPFLEQVNSGKTVGDAAYMAAQVVRSVHFNPCAWGALQVFGDPATVFTNDERSTSSG